jgi:hypothetical protein
MLPGLMGIMRPNPSAAGYRYYQIYVELQFNTADNFTSIAELKTGDSLATITEFPVSVTASTTFSIPFSAGNAIDGNVTTNWSSEVGNPQFLSLDFGSGASKNFTHFAITSRELLFSYQGPKAFRIKKGNSLAALSDVFFATDAEGWDGWETRIYDQTGTRYSYPSSIKVGLFIFDTEDNSSPKVSELEFKSSFAGANLSTGGAASAGTTNAGSNASFAFDGNTSTAWDSGATGSPLSWLRYTHASAFVCSAIKIRNQSAASGSPKNFKIQNVAPNGFALDQWRVIGQVGWSASEVREFAKPALLLRIKIIANNSSSNHDIGEIEFRETVGGADKTAPGYSATGWPFATGVLSTSFKPSNAFSNDGGATHWNKTAGTNDYIGYAFATAFTLAQVAITARSDGFTQDCPKDFTIERSLDGGRTWTILSSVTNQTAWSVGQTRLFTI